MKKILAILVFPISIGLGCVPTPAHSPESINADLEVDSHQVAISAETTPAAKQEMEAIIEQEETPSMDSMEPLESKEIPETVEKEVKEEPGIVAEVPVEEPKTVELDEEPSTEIEDVLSEPKPVVEEIQALSHASWDALVKKYVSSSGKVNYKGFKSEQAKLDAYLKSLNSNSPQSSWKRNEKLAYWINAYNAYTVKLILDNYPLKSIMDLEKPWDKKWIKIGTATYSLNNIEHDIIRKEFNEPRIHFAVNCASFSCPKLLNEAFTAAKLEGQLQKLTIAYINDARHNAVSANKAELSSLFDWYKGDFTKNGSLIDYINKYAKVKLSAGASISYKNYNWSLNE